MSRKYMRAVAPLVLLGVGSSAPLAASAEENMCAPVWAMITKFNAVPKVRFTGPGAGKGWSGIEDEIVIGPKQYSRNDSGSWTVAPRKIAPPETATNCALLRHEDVGGVAATVYQYERQINQDYKARVEMWISRETGLPLKSHFKALPLDNYSERNLTYSYGDDVKAPI